MTNISINRNWPSWNLNFWAPTTMECSLSQSQKNPALMAIKKKNKPDQHRGHVDGYYNFVDQKLASTEGYYTNQMGVSVGYESVAWGKMKEGNKYPSVFVGYSESYTESKSSISYIDSGTGLPATASWSEGVRSLLLGLGAYGFKQQFTVGLKINDYHQGFDGNNVNYSSLDFGIATNGLAGFGIPVLEDFSVGLGLKNLGSNFIKINGVYTFDDFIVGGGISYRKLLAKRHFIAAAIDYNRGIYRSNLQNNMSFLVRYSYTIPGAEMEVGANINYNIFFDDVTATGSANVLSQIGLGVEIGKVFKLPGNRNIKLNAAYNANVELINSLSIWNHQATGWVSRKF